MIKSPYEIGVIVFAIRKESDSFCIFKFKIKSATITDKAITYNGLVYDFIFKDLITLQNWLKTNMIDLPLIQS